MDKAVINNEIVSAYEISRLDDKSENLVREYSRNGKIFCADPHCKNPVLKYCHGDKKAAYFAHMKNADCDYHNFDKSDDPFRKELRIKLFHHFTSLGYKVDMECKLLAHHYSPLYCSKDNDSFVIEMGDAKTTLYYVQNILAEYTAKHISVKWIVIGEEILYLKENGVSFLKRYLFNNTKHNDFILVDGDKIIQYRWDKDNHGKCNFKETYCEKAEMQDLCMDDGELAIQGFNSRYLVWKKNKEAEIAQEIKRKAEKEKVLAKRKAAEKNFTRFINQQMKENSTVTEDLSAQLYTCTECGKIANESEFYMIQDDKGICLECSYGPEEYQKVLKYRKCRTS